VVHSGRKPPKETLDSTFRPGGQSTCNSSIPSSPSSSTSSSSITTNHSSNDDDVSSIGDGAVDELMVTDQELRGRGSILSTPKRTNGKCNRWWGKEGKENGETLVSTLKASTITTLKSMHFLPSSSTLDSENGSPTPQIPTSIVPNPINVVGGSVMRAVVLPKGKLGISFVVHTTHVVISAVKETSELKGVLGVGDVVVGIDEVRGKERAGASGLY